MLSSITNVRELSRILGVKYSYLMYYLEKKPVNTKYRKFQIHKKSGGTREIIAPEDQLANWQRIIADLLLSAYNPRSCVHGFVRDKSIKSNAEIHKCNRFVFNIDIQDFFPEITFARVRGALIKQPYNIVDKVATYIAKICCFENRLPQGAPSSPIFSNIICARLDTQLSNLAKKHYCYYSRYADDITFSKRSHSFPIEIGGLTPDGHAFVGNELLKAIEENNHFKINQTKVHFHSNKCRQIVTGLTVNQKVNVQRKFVRQIRAIIHDWKINQYEIAQKNHWAHRIDGRTPPLDAVVRGKLDYLRFIKGDNDKVYKNLASQLAEVDPHFKNILIRRNLEAQMRDFFISHASEDKNDIARPLAEELIRMGKKVWYDEYELRIGDSLRMKIEEGLTKSKYGIIILSHNFFSKKWPQDELNGLWAKESSSNKVILPIWFKINKSEVVSYAPMLSDRVAVCSDGTDITKIAGQIISST